jgi:thiol-disulfide isomerase/thioredoxin
MKNLTILFAFLFLFSCQSPNEKTKLQKGNWLFELHIDKENSELIIPFNVEVLDTNLLIIKNAEERIEVSEINYKNDSVFIKIPVFGSEFKGRFYGKSITGNYFNYNKTKISPIPFTAIFGVDKRFEINHPPTAQFSGNWQAVFGSGERSRAAIGVFNQNKNLITGTFQTEVGDFRYLEGVVNGNEMKLSCFDGAHAFLFTARQNDGKLEGMFYSGDSWKQEWTAERTDNPVLGDMKTLTFLKPGYDRISFSFPNEKGDTISLEDKKYENKVVIVQIFGTWCPNCMDETRYLVELYKQYNNKGLEIIGLDFETKNEFDYFKTRITRFRKDLKVPYELLFAGPSNKTEAAKSLPMLNKVISFPTAISIDKKGKVREIHTGFSGPGTGDAYEHYKTETEELIQALLNE